MTFSGNTLPYKTVWIRKYQDTHYKQAAFPMFADQRFENELTDGATIKWSYDADMGVQRMGADGGYTVDNRTATDETLTVDQRPTATFRIAMTEKIQDHRPTQEKWATKSMNVIYNDIDGVVLGALKTNAAGSLDASDFGGSANEPVDLSTSTAAAIFAGARRVLRNANVIYDGNKKFRNVIKFDHGVKFPVAAIPAELEEQLLLQIGFKNTELGDETLKQGYLGLIFGFNTVVSTALPFSFRVTQTGTPTDATLLKIGSGSTTVGSGTAIQIEWETGTIDAAGEVKAETSATVSITNLVNFLNAPYASISAKSFAFTRASMSIAQQRILDNVSAVDNGDGSCVITVNGMGAITVSTTETGSVLDRKSVWAIFGTSESVAVVMQRYPMLSVSAGALIGNGSTGGYVAQDFVTWALYGQKVFLSQTKQIVAVPIACSLFDSPTSTFN